jgi:AcrR family transcriptional regulator
VSEARITKRLKVDRDAIEHAAAMIANHDGLSSLSMSALATLLDVKSPSLYAHVTGIDEVKRMLALRGLADLENALARAALGKTTGEAVRAMLFAYVDYVREHPGVYAAMIPSPPLDDEPWLAAAAKLQSTTATVLSGFEFSPEEEIHALRGIRSLAHGFAAFEGTDAFRSPVDLDESFGWLVDVFLAGLQPKVEAHASREADSATMRTRGRSARAMGRKAATA